MDNARTSLIIFLFSSSDIHCISIAKVVPVFCRQALLFEDDFREGRRRVRQ